MLHQGRQAPRLLSRDGAGPAVERNRDVTYTHTLDTTHRQRLENRHTFRQNMKRLAPTTIPEEVLGHMYIERFAYI